MLNKRLLFKALGTETLVPAVLVCALVLLTSLQLGALQLFRASVSETFEPAVLVCCVHSGSLLACVSIEIRLAADLCKY